MTAAQTTPEEVATDAELAAYERALELELQATSLEAFTLATFYGYQMNWHHRVTCEVLDEFVFGNIDRLLIEMPPRHGKSELASRRLPAFILGNFPDAEIIFASYGADLSASMNLDVQRVMDSEEFRRIFPGVSIGGQGYKRTSDLFEVTGRYGAYRSVGVGGGITGRGADYLLIDDPTKNAEEAESQTYRDKLWDWYGSTAYTRLEGRGKVCVTATRWHEDDLIGRLKKQTDEGWHVLRLPALREDTKDARDPRGQEGDALWPEKFPATLLQRIKNTLGSYLFNALYQQRPGAAEGNMFKRTLWRFYGERPERFDTQIQSWDMTFKEKKKSDFVCGTVWGRIGADMFLLDLVNDRMDIVKTIQAVRSMSGKWRNAFGKYVEDKANGPAVVDLLKKEIPGLILVEPKGGKVVRANAVLPLIEAGNVHLPTPELAPWIQDFIEQCAAFPNGTNDDQVDSMTQALVNMAGDPTTRLQKLLRKQA